MAALFSYPLRLAAHDPAWADAFLARGAALGLALGRDVACGPEFTFDFNTLQRMPKAWFNSLGKSLRSLGLPCSVHLPFWDLHPASFDDHILAATRKTLALAVDRALRLEPAHCVGHVSFLKYVHLQDYDKFLARTLETWSSLLDVLDDAAPLLLENTHDESPQVLAEVVSSLNRPDPQGCGVCFDVGHWHCFNQGVRKRDLPAWLDALGPWIRACHLHDNDGSGDQHLAPGWGGIPFGQLFAELSRRNLAPTIVLEAHGEDAVQGAMQFLTTAQGPWHAYL